MKKRFLLIFVITFVSFLGFSQEIASATGRAGENFIDEIENREEKTENLKSDDEISERNAEIGKEKKSELNSNAENFDADAEIGSKKKERKKIDADWDFRFYLPSLLGLVAGKSPYFELRENPSEIDSCFNIMIEGRATIATVKRVTFSWSFACHGYTEFGKNPDADLMSINASLGVGAYFHTLDLPTYPLCGLCVFLYPAYDAAVYSQGYKPYLVWKCAYDFGFTFTLLKVITVYPYARGMIGWDSGGKERFGFDFGVALGFYIHELPKLVY